MSSCVPSGSVLPSSCIRGTKEKPNNFFSPFSFAVEGGKKKELVSYFTVCLHNLCSDTHIVEMSDHEEIEPPPHPLPLHNEEQLLWRDFCLQWPPSNPIVLPHNRKLFSLTNFLQGIHYLKLHVLFVFWSCRFPISSPHNPTSTP